MDSHLTYTSAWSPKVSRVTTFEALGRSPLEQHAPSTALLSAHVALENQRVAYNSLVDRSTQLEKAWLAGKAGLEDTVRVLTIQRDERERTLRNEVIDLLKEKNELRNKILELQRVGDSQNSQSSATIARLQARIGTLQQDYDMLEGRVATQRAELAIAQLAAERGREAEQRLQGVQSHLDAVKMSSNAAINQLTQESAALKAENEALVSELNGSLKDLAAERQLREFHQHHAFLLSVEKQQLVAALEQERAITARLRHVDHLTPTVSSILKKATSPGINDVTSAPSTPRGTRAGSLSAPREGRVSRSFSGRSLTQLARSLSSANFEARDLSVDDLEAIRGSSFSAPGSPASRSVSISRSPRANSPSPRSPSYSAKVEELPSPASSRAGSVSLRRPSSGSPLRLRD